MYASGRTTQTTMSEDVSVNKACARGEGETHELEEFTGKHLGRVHFGSEGGGPNGNRPDPPPSKSTGQTGSLSTM